MSKVRAELHEQILEEYRLGVSQSELARTYGLSSSSISRLVRRPLNWYGLDRETVAKCRAAQTSLKVASYIIATYQTTSMVEQARVLGKSVACIRQIQRNLGRAGAINRDLALGRRQRLLIRDPELVERVRKAVSTGRSSERIAAELGMTVGRLTWIIKINGGLAELRKTFTLQQIAALFKVQIDTVRRWVAKKWLAATRNGGRGTWHAVPKADVLAFLAVREAWLTYSACLIADPQLREAAEKTRAEAGGRWYTRREIAARLDVSVETVRRWSSKGWLSDVESATCGSAVFYWLPTNYAIAAPESLASLRHSGLLTLSGAADELGVSRPTLYKYINKHRLPVEPDNTIDRAKLSAWRKAFRAPRAGRPRKSRFGERHAA